MANKIDLSGRNAVVTGGAQGIGRAIVERFLESGAAVAIWDRDIELAKKTAGELQKRGRVAAVASMSPITPMWNVREMKRSKRSGASIFWSTTPALPGRT